jgi:DNA topoisomerase-1
VGRPSTYAPTISTLVDRGYIISQDKKLVPEKIGLSVNKMLEDNFSSIVDVNLTAKLEQELDAVSLGKDKWQKIVADFYNPLAKDIENKKDSIERIKVESEQTGENCPECKHPLVIRSSRYGKFVGCSNYPECRYIKKEALEKTNVKCPECKKGEIVAKKTRKGRVFYGCDQYPDCKYASWTKP